MMRESVLLVIFDLPVQSTKMRREYSRFRSGLLKLGYVQLQKSFYYKMITNVSSVPFESEQVKKSVPAEGEILFLPLPLSQFLKMQTLLGETFNFARLTSPILEID